MIRKTCLAILLVFLTALSACANQKNTCLVVGVSDGDTLTCLTPHKNQIKVRLAEIDAPEKGQPFGQKAKKALSDKVFKRTVQLEITGKDRYHRTLATVYYKGENINLAMVKQGMAWAYRQYLQHPIYLQAQEEAKAQKLGLWRDNSPIPPHEWRKLERKHGF